MLRSERGLERLPHAVVRVDPARDVHRRDRDVGAERLDDGSCGRRRSRTTPWHSRPSGRTRERDGPAAGRPSHTRAWRCWCAEWPSGPSWRPGGTRARRPWASAPCPPTLFGAVRRTRRTRPCRTCGPLRGAGSFRACQPPFRRANDQRAPEGVSSMTMPASASRSRIASAASKSLAARADWRASKLVGDRVRRERRARRPRRRGRRCPRSARAGSPRAPRSWPRPPPRPRAPRRRHRRRGRCCPPAPCRGRRPAPRTR